MVKKRLIVFILIIPIISFLIVAIFLRVFSKQPPTAVQEVPTTFTTYTSPVASFSLQVPENWAVENPPHSPNPYLVFAAWNAEMQVEVTLEYRDFGSLEKFRERVRDDITIFPGVTITGEGKTTVNRSPAYWFDYLFPGERGEMQGRLYLFSRNQGFYRIICLSSRKNFTQHLPILERIIQSFTFVTNRDTGS